MDESMNPFLDEPVFNMEDPLFTARKQLYQMPMQSTPTTQPQMVQPPVPHVVMYQQPAPVVTKVGTFSGYMNEDGAKFINDFEAYMTLAGIDPLTPRATAAFHLHLSGPARTWFAGLLRTDSWQNVKNSFEEEFCSTSSPTMIAESAMFDALRLKASQPIEDFHAAIVEKGRKLNKSQHDILQKFISGLPTQLAFFVRAGRVTSLREAFQSAKIGEAHGYREDKASSGAPVPEVVAAS